jgi:murein DD-endopeptidase MepM/ murein hydrolase activator NlpD
LHGLQRGVRDVFAARETAVDPMNIIGTTVMRGEPIMLADSTGISLCNHVHLEVRVGPPPSDPPPVTSKDYKMSIPFVFKDGGQPHSMEWLVSSNHRIPPRPAGEPLETEPVAPADSEPRA